MSDHVDGFRRLAVGLLGFDPQAGEANSGFALMALAVIYAWVPIALKLSVIALMWNFPLDETEHIRLRGAIERD